MKHKKILLVANDNLEILNVQRELTKHHVDHSLHIAKNGLDALALLMGCSSPQLENYTKTGKVQPDIILMDAEGPNLNMIELLCIMQKYYSLQKIRVYLMVTDLDKIDLPEAKKYGIAGVVSKPFDMESTKFDAQKLMVEFGKSPQKAWIPFLTILPVNFSFSKCLSFLSKIKYSTLQFTSAVAVKTGIAGTVVVGGVLMGASFNSSKQESSVQKSRVVSMPAENQVPRLPVIAEDLFIDETEPATEVKDRAQKIPKKQSATFSTSVSPESVKEQKPERNFRIVVTEEEVPSELN